MSKLHNTPLVSDWVLQGSKFASKEPISGYLFCIIESKRIGPENTFPAEKKESINFKFKSPGRKCESCFPLAFGVRLVFSQEDMSGSHLQGLFHSFSQQREGMEE